MPRGNGATYRYSAVKEAVYEFLCSLKEGDMYTGADIAVWLRPFKGLSKRDKESYYCLPKYTLERSITFWTMVANKLIRQYDLPIVKKVVKISDFESGNNLTYYEYELGIDQTYYVHTGY
jgi:hypothetical protein